MTPPFSPKIEQVQHSRFVWTFLDTGVMMKRNLLQIRHDLEQLMGLTLQPIMFVVLFRFVFGGAIETGGVSYVNFLMAGIFVQTAAFGSTMTGFTIAGDKVKGIMDRFRSLPMVKSAVLSGHVLADLARNAFATIVMVAAGLAVGFRPEASVIDWLGVLGILLLFTFALSWVFAIVGLTAKSVEVVQQGSFIWVFPLTFVSSAFVPTSTMPWWLRAFAENQPVTHVVEAVRGLLLNQPIGNHGWISVAWSVGILLIAFPIASALFRKQAK